MLNRPLSRRGVWTALAALPVLGSLLSCTSRESVTTVEPRLRADLLALPGVTAADVSVFYATFTPKIVASLTSSAAERDAVVATLDAALRAIVTNTASLEEAGEVECNVRGQGVEAYPHDLGLPTRPLTLAVLRTR